MPQRTHRIAANRPLDCIYDPNNVWSSKKDLDRAKNSARSHHSVTGLNEKQTSYRRMFEDVQRSAKRIEEAPKLAKRVEFSDKNTYRKSVSTARSSTGSLSSCLSIRPEKERLKGGANVCDSADKGYICRRPIPCPPHTPEANVNMMHISFPPKVCPKKPCYEKQFIRTKGTQTLYRESSAQTLPYLPGVANDEADLEKLELFKLPSILPGDGPPGLYEVEVLERARKRWAFKQALRIHFKNHVRSVREEIRKAENKMILEAFEWEHWIEREEDMQECQMMRLELLVRMFDKREKEMHDASKKRIEMSAKEINAKKEQRLRQNEIEFGREMRRLEMKHRKIPRNWRKENITKELGDPSSEFYAPLMRYGVNPNRRHFAGTRKEFEERIYMLERRVVGVKDLECPFDKISAWAKPKTRIKELEKNFCSEKNLKNLYDSLKSLRELAQRTKEPPRCLVERTPPASDRPSARTISTWIEPSDFNEEIDALEEAVSEQDTWPKKLKCKDRRGHYKKLLEEKRREEIENMLLKYEGTTIGWLMRFLAQEEQRLREQRRLHFISMIAQKERCRREALAEILLRKENEMRDKFEKMYEKYEAANDQVGRDFLDDIFGVDPKIKADADATGEITDLAKLIDKDIERWLKSFECIQTPLNYEPLRHLLKDFVFPDADEIIAKKESGLVVNYIIEEVLMPHVFELLEPYDIGTYIANHTVDRLIDNDLEYFSSECSCCSDDEVKSCSESQREAMAIMRKVIRRAVPGRRWKTENERVVYSNVEDIVDLALNEAFIQSERRSTLRNVPLIRSDASYWDLMCGQKFKSNIASSACSSSEDKLEHIMINRNMSIAAKRGNIEDDGVSNICEEEFAFEDMLSIDTKVTDGLNEPANEDQNYVSSLLQTIINKVVHEEEPHCSTLLYKDDFMAVTMSMCPDDCTCDDAICTLHRKPEDIEEPSTPSTTESKKTTQRITSDEDPFIRTQSEYERDLEEARQQQINEELSFEVSDDLLPHQSHLQALLAEAEGGEHERKKQRTLTKSPKSKKSEPLCPKCRKCPVLKKKQMKPKALQAKSKPCYVHRREPSEIDFAPMELDAETFKNLAETVGDDNQFDVEGTLPLNQYSVCACHQVTTKEDSVSDSSTDSFSCLLTEH